MQVRSADIRHMQVREMTETRSPTNAGSKGFAQKYKTTKAFEGGASYNWIVYYNICPSDESRSICSPLPCAICFPCFHFQCYIIQYDSPPSYCGLHWPCVRAVPHQWHFLNGRGIQRPLRHRYIRSRGRGVPLLLRSMAYVEQKMSSSNLKKELASDQG